MDLINMERTRMDLLNKCPSEFAPCRSIGNWHITNPKNGRLDPIQPMANLPYTGQASNE